MNVKKILLVISSVAVIISCKVAQPYTQPAGVAGNNLYRGVSATDTNTIADISWKDMFADPLLQALIQEGINNNLDLKMAVARIKTAAANAWQSKLALLPSVDANASASFQRVPSTQFGFPETYQLYVNSSWEADIWGKLGSAKRAALAALLQSDAYKRAVQTQLVAGIANNYYLLMAYDAQLQITEQTVANRREEVETMKTLKESDVVNGAAVVQSEANLYSAQITVTDLKQSIHETENAISVLLGRNPDSIARSTLAQQAVTTNLATGVPAQLLANRPDVQEAEYQFRGAFEQVNVARTYFYPSLKITASAGLSGTSISQLFDLSTFFANITGSLLQPIFEKGVNKQRLAVAQATEEEYLADFKKSLLTAGQEVSDALFSYQSAKEKEGLRQQQVSYLQKSVDFTKELLKYSSATNYTDVLVSEQNLLSAQLSGISDKLQQLTAVVNLYSSLGGGWK
ncbi:MAG TPA: efflux transporter outer membrane subunit [Chitinophagaceae bacterium]|nr:efflux transporter outer membrane subunit [Chitinophagaceae bacterium]